MSEDTLSLKTILVGLDVWCLMSGVQLTKALSHTEIGWVWTGCETIWPIHVWISPYRGDEMGGRASLCTGVMKVRAAVAQPTAWITSNTSGDGGCQLADKMPVVPHSSAFMDAANPVIPRDQNTKCGGYGLSFLCAKVVTQFDKTGWHCKVNSVSLTLDILNTFGSCLWHTVSRQSNSSGGTEINCLPEFLCLPPLTNTSCSHLIRPDEMTNLCSKLPEVYLWNKTQVLLIVT